MPISVAVSLADGTMKSINFTDTLGHRKKVPKSDKCSDANCYWLNPEWRDNTKTFRAEVITPYFVLMAHEAGFKENGDWDGKTSSIIFKCIRSRQNNPHTNIERATKHRPQKNLKKPHATPLARNRNS